MPPTPQDTLQARPEGSSFTHKAEYAKFTRALGVKLSEESRRKREAEYPGVFEQWSLAKTQKDKQDLFRKYLEVGCDLMALEGRIIRSVSKKKKRERRYLKKTEKEPRAVRQRVRSNIIARADRMPPPSI
jgi:hypothetical protein